MAKIGGSSALHLSVIRWISDNFYACEGCTTPRWLLYHLYTESCRRDSKYQVNAATFGKLIRLVFPGLKTRRLGRRRNARYHYAGIAVKETSALYQRYCFLLAQDTCHRHSSPEEASTSACQPSTSAGPSGDACSSGDACCSGGACCSGDAAAYLSQSQGRIAGKDLQCSPAATHLQPAQEGLLALCPEPSTFWPWELEPQMKYSYERVVLLANNYYSHCQEILHMVRNSELDKVQECIMAFWMSLQPESTALLALPDVCQLLRSCDRQLFKEMESILFHDFLEEVPAQYLISVTSFSKNLEGWLLNALAGFPLPLQTSKSEEVAVFIRRLRRKTELSNMAKTMRAILSSDSKVVVLRSDLRAVMSQGCLDEPANLLQADVGALDELQNNIELKCLNDLMHLLEPSTDIRVLLNCVHANLQASVIQASRSPEEFRKLASAFQLRWNFLLSTVSKAMTLNYANGFGSWHLFNLLLVDFVAHIFTSYREEQGGESLQVAKQNEYPVVLLYDPSQGCFVEVQAEASAAEPAVVAFVQSQDDFSPSSVCPEF